jgi:flagellar hook assembly protein FlgD
MLSVLAYGLASAATSVDLSVPSWNERYFSPNGDDQEDTATVLYCLGQSANVTTTVTDDGGARVRTIEDGVSRAGNDACWNNQVTWDGQDDAGKVVAAGVYTLRRHAVDAGGGTGDASVRLGGGSARPGGAGQPVAGGHGVGDDALGVRPRDRLPAGLGGGQLPQRRRGRRSRDGARGERAFTGDLDTATCADGSNKVDAWASWHDPFGQSHSWLAPAVEVTVANPPRVAVAPWSERSFSPNGDDQEDTATVSYCVSAAATVTASVTADDGSPVRTLEPAEVTAGFACNSWNNQVAWDGKLDCGLRSKNVNLF